MLYSLYPSYVAFYYETKHVGKHWIDWCPCLVIKVENHMKVWEVLTIWVFILYFWLLHFNHSRLSVTVECVLPFFFFQTTYEIKNQPFTCMKLWKVCDFLLSDNCQTARWGRYTIFRSSLHKDHDNGRNTCRVKIPPMSSTLGLSYLG